MHTRFPASFFPLFSLFFAALAHAQPAPPGSAPAAAVPALSSSGQAAPPLAPGPSAARPAPVVTPPPGAGPSPLALGRCSRGDLERLQHESGLFMVEVHSTQGFEATMGFVYGSAESVVVPYREVIDLGGPIQVFYRDKSSRTAEIVQVDERKNLALLRVQDPPSWVRGLQGLNGYSTPEAPREMVGLPVVTFKLPMHKEGVTLWPVFETAVSGWLADRLSLAGYPAKGAPILTCEGALLGVHLHERQTLDLDAIEELQAGKGAAQPGSRWVGLGVSGAHLILTGRKGELGVGLRSSLLDFRYRDAFELQLGIGFHFLTGIETRDDYPATDRSGVRYQADLTAGYRFRFQGGAPGQAFLHAYLTPRLGVVLRSETLFQRTLLASPACGGATSCPVTEHRESSTTSAVDPMAGLDINLMGLDLFYSFQLNTKSARDSLHVFGLGASF